ncbi:hypothetical protein [Aureimonas sp. SK2]|uniref:hypothetical protein n=1 Tax=Aureimonas sp. SK2 TaxID=3015992 RepID=UPI00244426E4|nr:hypothetical protein [Aureimonas sp. SK2]
MIATALVFALGALVASFVALIFAPILWSNAQRLARREFHATIPATVREMRGELDAVRARAAFDIHRDAMRHRAVQDAAVRERAEAGRAILENGQLRARQAELEREIAESAGRAGRLEEDLRVLVAERDALLATRQDLRGRLERRESELAALDAKFQRLSQAFDEQRFRLATAEARIVELTPAPLPPAPAEAPGAAATMPLVAAMALPKPLAEPQLDAPAPVSEPDAAPSGNSRLRAAIARGSADKTPASHAEHAEIRERIGDIAARVIHERIKVEGADSQLARMIADAPPPAADAGEPLLADRVRRLQDEEKPVRTTPAKTGGAGRARRKSRR